MATSIGATLRFFGSLVRDVAGTLRSRWRRFHARVVEGQEFATVAVDVFPFFERMTGVGWYEWNLLEALDRADDCLSFNLYGHTFLSPQESAPLELPGSRRMRMRLHQLPEGFALPLGWTIKLLRITVEPLLRILDDNDVLFAPNFFVPRSQAPYGRATVATVHDLAFKVMPRSVARETLRELNHHLPGTLYRADRLIAVSEATAEDLTEFLDVGRHRVHTIHEGLDPRFAASADAELPAGVELPERYLLFVSTLEPRKNVCGVLKAFQLLADWGYRGDLLLVGQWGWRTSEIRKVLDSSRVRDRIHRLDYVERSVLPAIYRRSDALLFPSWLEGFGLPLLEGMACGTPVVTSGVSAMPEVAGPAAVYVDPGRPQGIASAVAALIEDPRHRERLVELGRRRAASFSWDRAAAATAQVLRQAAGLSPTGDDTYRV